MAIALFGFTCDQPRCAAAFEDVHCRDSIIYSCEAEHSTDQDVVVPEQESPAETASIYPPVGAFGMVDNSAYPDMFCDTSQRKDRLLQLRKKFVDSENHCCLDDPVDISFQREGLVHPQQIESVRLRKYSRPRRADAPVEPANRAVLRTPPRMRSLQEIACSENHLAFPLSVRSNPLPKARAAKAGTNAGNLENSVKKDDVVKVCAVSPLVLDNVVGARSNSNLNCQSKSENQGACEDVQSPTDPEQDENWGEGTIRVLIVCGDRDDEENQPRSLLEQLQRWCNLCKIDEVDTVLLPQEAGGGSRLLADALTAVGAKSQPGDVCVLILAELTSTQLFMNGGNGLSEHLLASRHLFLSTLPTNLTVICISDSSSTLEAIGLGPSTLATSWDANLRAIVMSVAFEESAKRRGQLLVDALEHTKSALSLSEGPSGLTCADFFEELTDQAFDIAAKAALSKPSLSMYAHPSENLPSIVRWPVAALPRYGARKRSSRSSSASREIRLGAVTQRELSDDQPQAHKFFNIAKVVACTEAAPDDNATTAESQKDQLPPKSSHKSASKSRRKSREVREGTPNRRKPRGSSNAPANIDQFSAMLSGGLLNKAQRDSRENVA